MVFSPGLIWSRLAKHQDSDNLIENQLYDSFKEYLNLYLKTLFESEEVGQGLQQELINVELMTKYNFLFMFQSLLNCFGSSYNILPERYMKCTHIGYVDKDGKYLLEKVLEN